MKKIFISAGLVLLLVGLFTLWRQLHPPLADEQQILAIVEDIRASTGHKNWREIRSYMTDDFRYSNLKRSDVISGLEGASFQYRSIDMHLSGVEVQATGDSATASGHYDLETRAETNSPPQQSAGDFKLSLRKEDGSWLIYKAEGGQIPGF